LAPCFSFLRQFQNPCCASAPGHPLSLAGHRILFVYCDLRQSLLRPGAAYASGKLQNLPVLQLALFFSLGLICYICFLLRTDIVDAATNFFEWGGAKMMMNLGKNERKRLLLIYFSLFVCALLSGAVGMTSVYLLAKADRQLYTVGVEDMGAITKVKEEFAWIPIHVRNIIIETDPVRRAACVEEFNKRKRAVQNLFGRLPQIVSGDPTKEELYNKASSLIDDFWKKVGEVVKRAAEGNTAEAVPYMLRLAFPQYVDANGALGNLQEEMRQDAARQQRSNGTVSLVASIATVACAVIMVVLSFVFALYVEHLRQPGTADLTMP